MRVLLVGAGADIAIRDVEDGFRRALGELLGDGLYFYDLAARLSLAQRWLSMLWRARGAVPEDRPSWPEAIYRGGVEALEMALRFQVDWVIAISGMFLHPDALGLMKRAGLRTGVIFTESPYEDAAQARVASLVDVCWTSERSSVPRLQMANRKTQYLPHAYDPQRHAPAAPDGPDDVPAHDVVFVGTGFHERVELLADVDWAGIDFGLYGTWTLLGSRHPLRQHLRGGTMTNARTIALYRRAKIGLNLYRSSERYGRNAPRVAEAESLNPRAYELAACGVFQISDWRPEVAEVFGSAVPTVDSAAELSAQLRYFLAHPEGRAASAHRARLAVQPQTFAARAAQLLEDLDAVEDSSQPLPALAGQKGA